MKSPILHTQVQPLHDDDHESPYARIFIAAAFHGSLKTETTECPARKEWANKMMYRHIGTPSLSTNKQVRVTHKIFES